MILVRSNSWIDRLVVCKDCKHVAMDQERHKQHFKEARHINTLRSMAYRYKKTVGVWWCLNAILGQLLDIQNILLFFSRFPMKRSFWLSIWYTSIEKVEKENPWALAFDETEENV